jgi:hypothetical protein
MIREHLHATLVHVFFVWDAVWESEEGCFSRKDVHAMLAVSPGVEEVFLTPRYKLYSYVFCTTNVPMIRHTQAGGKRSLSSRICTGVNIKSLNTLFCIRR